MSGYQGGGRGGGGGGAPRKQFDNTNRGVGFPVREKRFENGPDYEGSANLDGVEYFQDFWITWNEDGTIARINNKFKKKNKQPEAQGGGAGGGGRTSGSGGGRGGGWGNDPVPGF
jgi:hypothetical protein